MNKLMDERVKKVKSLRGWDEEGEVWHYIAESHASDVGTNQSKQSHSKSDSWRSQWEQSSQQLERGECQVRGVRRSMG